RATLARKLVPRSSTASFPQLPSSIERRRDDLTITGAPTQMPGKEFPQLRFLRVWIATEIPIERHQDARGAKPALQGVVASKGLLQHRQLAWSWRKPFDSAQPCTIQLNGKGEASARRHAVDLDCARAAYTVLTTYMCARHAEGVTEE